MESRVVLHSDLNNCYASIECMLDPSLRGKRIAVCGSTEERHGIVLAKNQEAKKFGVKTGMAIWQAKQACPNLTIVSPHMDQYMKFSRIVRAIYKRYSPEVEAFGIDESWIEMTGSALLRKKSGEEIANEIRETVKSEVGLTVSVGVSFNKIFAKLGSDMKKPDAVTCIPKECFQEIVWPLPVEDLLYVGRATTQKLNRYCIRTIGDLARMDVKALDHMLGKNGIMLWGFANGLDNSRVMPCEYTPPVKSVGHGITCMADLESLDEVRLVFMQLSQEIGLKLRKHGLAAQAVQIGVRDNELNYAGYQCKLPYPTQSYTEIWQAGNQLFQDKHYWKNNIRSLTIRAIDLVPASDSVQLDLWSDYKQHERHTVIERTVEDIRRRYGDGIINYAVLTQNIKLPGIISDEHQMPSLMYR
jgi:DNA polymerase-4